MIDDSALVTGRPGAEERSVLFDVGPSADVWPENARRLGVRLASIEAVCLSHGTRRSSIYTRTGPTSEEP